jgi:O-antigen ligase
MMAVAFSAPLNGLRYHSVTLIDVLLVVAGVAVGFDVLSGRPAVAAPPRPFTVGAALIVAGGLLGTLVAPNPAASMTNLTRFTLSCVGPVLLVFAWRPDPEALRRFTWLWIAGATTSAAFALVSAGDAAGRPKGLATHPNQLAVISSLAAALAFAAAISERRGRRWVAVAAYAVVSLAVLRSGSRAGLIALVVAVLVVLGRTRRTRRDVRHLAGAMAGLLFVAVALLSTGSLSVGRHDAVRRFLGDRTAVLSDEGHVALLVAGLHTAAAHPLTGAGFQDALRSHNIYVEVAASGGVAALAGLLLVMATIIRAGIGAERRDGEWLTTGFVAGFAGYLVAGLFQNILWDRYLWLYAAMLLWVQARPAVGSRPDAGAEDQMATAPDLYRRGRP